MGTHTLHHPVNPHQIAQVLVTGYTIREGGPQDHPDPTIVEIDSPRHTDTDLAKLLDGIKHDPTVEAPTHDPKKIADAEAAHLAAVEIADHTERVQLALADVMWHIEACNWIDAEAKNVVNLVTVAHETVDAAQRWVAELEGQPANLPEGQPNEHRAFQLDLARRQLGIAIEDVGIAEANAIRAQQAANSFKLNQALPAKANADLVVAAAVKVGVAVG
jgi:hypothetical protein